MAATHTMGPISCTNAATTAAAQAAVLAAYPEVEVVVDELALTFDWEGDESIAESIAEIINPFVPTSPVPPQSHTAS